MAELPQNWQKEYLTNICNVYQPKTISTKELLANGSYPVYGANGQIGYYDKYNHEFSEVLITCRGATCGNINKSVPKSWINGNAMVASPISNAILDKNYLFYYLKNTSFADYISGTAQPQITRTSLTKMPVIYPPLNEQKRIVEKLDKIIRIVDGVNARLDKIPTALKRARQSILNQVITGELTKDWREKNNIKDTWKETSLKSIVLTYKNGLSKRSGKEGKATVVLRLADFCNHKIIKDNIREIKITDNEAKQYRLDYNDILIIRVNGSEDIVGRFILYDLNENWIYCDHLIRLKYDKTKIEPYYLFYYAQTNVVREYIKANVVSSAGQNTINQKTLDNMPLLLPSIDEQAEIVRRVKLAFEKLDKIELRYQKTKEYSDKLTQSILNKAFRGELVPQDPSDKPISLDEIQAQIVEKSSKKRKTLKNNKVQEMVKEIIEILKEYPEGISPEELFKNSKYSQKDFTDDDIIEFYKELSNLLDSKLTEEKDSVNHKILIKKVK